MKLHPLTAAESVHYPVMPAMSLRSANNSFIWPQAEAGCIAKCVGTSAATECAYCGADIACWEQCAGSGRGNCIADCFNTAGL